MNKFLSFLKTVTPLIGILAALPVFSYVHKPFHPELFEFVAEEYGISVRARLQAFEDIIIKDQKADIFTDLRDVNDFFNQVQWISDSLHWGMKDYWQTPLETLVEFEGDCEDIAIAKYTALRVMGVPEKNLALVYTFINNEPHMVLAYYPDHHNDPYILDSYVKEIKLGSQRLDLVSVYEFNSTSVWLTDTHFIKKDAAKPEHIALVDEVKQRMMKNRELLKTHNNGEPTVPFSFDTL